MWAWVCNWWGQSVPDSSLLVHASLFSRMVHQFICPLEIHENICDLGPWCPQMLFLPIWWLCSSISLWIHLHFIDEIKHLHRFTGPLDFLSYKRGSVQVFWVVLYLHFGSQKFFIHSGSWSFVSFMRWGIFSHSVACLFTLLICLWLNRCSALIYTQIYKISNFRWMFLVSSIRNPSLPLRSWRSSILPSKSLELYPSSMVFNPPELIFASSVQRRSDSIFSPSRWPRHYLLKSLSFPPPTRDITSAVHQMLIKLWVCLWAAYYFISLLADPYTDAIWSSLL